MKKYGQTSIWDKLIDIMPELKGRFTKSVNYVDPIAANSLYSLWRTGSQKVNDRTYKKPHTMGAEEVRRMKDAGLVKMIGDNIELTAKGSDVIKVMILGDNKSVFDDDGIIIDYTKALETMKPKKLAKKHKAASWWDRFEKEAYEIEPKYVCKCGEEFMEAPTKRIGDETHYVCPTCGSSNITPNPYLE
jgi:predicted methyltransferase